MVLHNAARKEKKTAPKSLSLGCTRAKTGVVRAPIKGKMKHNQAAGMLKSGPLSNFQIHSKAFHIFTFALPLGGGWVV
jgi:hypothetical protein